MTRSLLESVPEVDPHSIVEHNWSQPGENPQDLIRWDFASSSALFSGYALVGDRLRQLNFEIAGTTAVEQFIHEFGIPRYADVGSPPVPVTACEVSLGWPDAGLIAGYYEEGSFAICHRVEEGGRLPHDLPISRIVLFPAGAEFQPELPCCQRYPFPGLDR